jgi:hypothetical protein
MNSGTGSPARWARGGGSGPLGLKNDLGTLQPDREDPKGGLSGDGFADDCLLSRVVFLLRSLHHIAEKCGRAQNRWRLTTLNLDLDKDPSACYVNVNMWLRTFGGYQ